MKIVQGILTATLCLTSIGLSPLLAGTQGPRFDDGVDTSKALEELKRRVSDDKAPAPEGQITALLHISTESVLSPKFALKGQPSTLGWVFGPWQQFILNDPNRPEALEILPRLETLPADVRDPLKKEWSGLETVRGDLLMDAVALERVDKQLYDDAVTLDQEAEDLERQGDLLRQEIRDFNDACVDRPLPPDQYQRCLRWQADLKNRIGQYNQAVEYHNQQVEAWKIRAYGDEGKARRRMNGGVRGAGWILSQNMSNWGGKVRPWIDASKKALEAKCRELDRIDVDPPLARVWTGGIVQPFDARPIFKPEPAGASACPVDFSWFLQAEPDVPGRSIGVISSTSGRAITFISGIGTGRGILIVKDELSPIGTNSMIYVFNPAK